MAKEEYDPPKQALTCRALDQFLLNQIVYNESLLGARRGFPAEKSEDSMLREMLIGELKNLRWKARHIFYEATEGVSSGGSDFVSDLPDGVSD